MEHNEIVWHVLKARNYGHYNDLMYVTAYRVWGYRHPKLRLLISRLEVRFLHGSLIQYLREWQQPSNCASKISR